MSSHRFVLLMSLCHKNHISSFLGAVAYVHGASIIQPGQIPSGSPLSATIAVADQDFLWKYASQTGITGAVNPPMWNTLAGAGVCDTGNRQSPIDIVAATTTVAAADPGAVTSTLFDTDISGVLVNTGRVLRWMASLDGIRAIPTITGGPLAAKV